jgi:uncharacterized repeat protein (TIGR03803 family)
VGGAEPAAGVIFDKVGNLYGTAAGGGAYQNGTVFELTPKHGQWTEKVLHTFTGGKDGGTPNAGLMFDAAGNLYGTTVEGGSCNVGAVFELIPNHGKWTEKVLHSFNCNGTDGIKPEAGLIFDAAGNLYGTTLLDATNSAGTVFELLPSRSKWAEKVLHRFSTKDKNGYWPSASLILDKAGNLYGTTAVGGSTGCFGHGCGTVFELILNQGKWTEKVLHTFVPDGKDGRQPVASLIFDPAGNLYGTTSNGGTYRDIGTVFELTPTADGIWTEKVIHSFGNGNDGALPVAALAQDAAGNLYGTTAQGGTLSQQCYPSGCGTVFELVHKDGIWTEKVLHAFNSSDGVAPEAGLIFDPARHLYGTTFQGGTNYSGTIFEITP